MKLFLYKLAKKNKFLGSIIRTQQIEKLKKNLNSNPAVLNSVLGNFTIHHSGTDDHISVINSTILKETYNITFCPQGKELLQRFNTKGNEQNLILDLGAHIGVSMVYFASVFPEALIIGVEPNIDSIKLLERNLCKLEINRWKVFNACIGANDFENVAIYDNNNGSWAISLLNYTNQNKPLAYVNKISLKSLLDEYQDLNNLILKVDIEGAEKELFQDRGSWIILNSFELVIIELHDWMLPGENSSLPVFEWAINFEREIIVQGVNVFLFKK